MIFRRQYILHIMNSITNSISICSLSIRELFHSENKLHIHQFAGQQKVEKNIIQQELVYIRKFIK